VGVLVELAVSVGGLVSVGVRVLVELAVSVDVLVSVGVLVEVWLGVAVDVPEGVGVLVAVLLGLSVAETASVATGVALCVGCESGRDVLLGSVVAVVGIASVGSAGAPFTMGRSNSRGVSSVLCGTSGV
jgi:hypothetical protein